MLFRPCDPLFPSTSRIAAISGDHRLTKEHWQTAEPVRAVCRKACEQAGVPYFSPHTVRRTLAVMGARVCATAEEMKAWSQNLGHLEILTTMMSYGGLTDRRQAQVMKQIEWGSVDDGTKGVLAFFKAKGFHIEARFGEEKQP